MYQDKEIQRDIYKHQLLPRGYVSVNDLSEIGYGEVLHFRARLYQKGTILVLTDEEETEFLIAYANRLTNEIWTMY